MTRTVGAGNKRGDMRNWQKWLSEINWPTLENNEEARKWTVGKR